VRNIIYHHVARAPSGLVFFLRRKNFIITSSNRQVPTEANVLKRVCKTTRAETRHMDIQVNEVKVEGLVFARMMNRGDWRLKNFTGIMDIQNVPGLGLNPSPHILHDCIFAFARNNPDATIQVRVNDLAWATPGCSMMGFLCLAWTIEKAVRDLKKRSFVGIGKAVKSWKGPGKDVNLKNITFRTQQTVFNEGLFIQRIRGLDSQFVNKYALKLYGSEEAFVKAVRAWYELGL